MTTSADVAQWMVEQIEADPRGRLDQWSAARRIRTDFGEEFVYTNDRGNVAISRAVLGAFRAQTKGTVVWDRWDQAWYKRQPSEDGPSRLRGVADHEP